MNFNHYNFILQNIPSKIMTSSLSLYIHSKFNKYKASTLFFIGCSLSLSSYYITSYIINKQIDNKMLQDNIKKTLDKVVEEPYENKYYDAFDKLESKELSEEYIKSLQNCVLYETTSKGNIIMSYDHSNESFNYYCDTKDISYLYLETVARRYAITYKCKKLLADIKKELQLTKNKKVNFENDESNEKKKTNNLFASFKTYNKKGVSSNEKGDGKKMNKKSIICANANRYSYKGKVNDFQFIKTNDYKVQKISDSMDYQTFKKLMDSKQ